MSLGTGPGQKYGSNELSAAVSSNRHRVWLPRIPIRTGFDSPFPEFSNEMVCVGMRLQKSCVAPSLLGTWILCQSVSSDLLHTEKDPHCLTSLPAPVRHSWASSFCSIFVIVKMTLSLSLPCESPLLKGCLILQWKRTGLCCAVVGI